MKAEKIGLFLLVLCFGMLVFAEDKDKNTEVIENYYSRLLETMEDYDQLVKFRNIDPKISGSIMTKIIDKISSTDDISEKCNGIFILGMLKDSSAVPFLIKNLELENPQYIEGGVIKPISEPPMISWYPAQQALISIGIASIPNLEKEFMSSESEAVRYICLDTIFDINLRGYLPEIAEFIMKYSLKDKIEKNPPENAKELLKELDDFKRGKTLSVLYNTKPISK